MLRVRIDINGRLIATLTAVQVQRYEGTVRGYKWHYHEEGIGGSITHDREDGALELAEQMLRLARLHPLGPEGSE